MTTVADSISVTRTSDSVLLRGLPRNINELAAAVAEKETWVQRARRFARGAGWAA